MTEREEREAMVGTLDLLLAIITLTTGGEASTWRAQPSRQGLTPPEPLQISPHWLRKAS